MKNILILCAHPDDETLGLGGTLAIHKNNKDNVHVIIFTTGQFGRDESKKGIETRKLECERACKILGVKTIEFLNYDDQKLEFVNLTELTNHIESFIKKLKPNTVYTHFWGDMNQDHRRVYEASIIATRPKKNSSIKELICYETPSSTDNPMEFNNFNPNYFVDIQKVVTTKIKAVKQYKNEIPKSPHPRSVEAIQNRAKYWGSTINLNYAEAFLKIREIQSVY
jgi:N-acetylglucosamine malate deacetylase 1